MADRIQPTPRNKLLGLLADALGGAYDYAQRPDPTMPMGLANPVLGLLADALPLRAGANVLDDLSYGQAPIRGTGMTTRLNNDATELAMAAAPFPKTSGKAALAALGAVDTGASGLGKAAIVWHGSPHRFNAFDASKIGAGEGAQAYGHGLYLAELPEVAGSYIQAGRNVGFTNFDDPIRLANKAFGKAQGNTQAALGLLDDAISSTKPGSRQNNLIFAKRVIERGDQTASLYKTELPDNMIARMLDWDRPLSQQAVNDLLANIDWKARSSSTRGSDLYGRMSDVLGDQATAAAELRKAGIPGIRYLDGGSRGVGAGTSNFVVFPGEENALTILQRNGRSLLD